MTKATSDRIGWLRTNMALARSGKRRLRETLTAAASLVLWCALGLSVVMLWEVFLPATFATVFHRPFRVWLETSYFFPLTTSLVVLLSAAYDALCAPHSIKIRVFRLLLAVAWCGSVFFLALLISFRALI